MHNDSLLRELTRYFQDFDRYNATLYFLTLTYIDSSKKLLSMESALYRFNNFHQCLLRYLCGTDNIGRAWFRKIEPAVFAFIDEPASKLKPNKPHPPSASSTGYHHHCIIAVHPQHRKKMDSIVQLDRIILKHPHFKDCTGIKSVNLQRLEQTIAGLQKVLDYCTAHVRRNGELFQDMICYPKAKSEFHKWKNIDHWLKGDIEFNRKTSSD